MQSSKQHTIEKLESDEDEFKIETVQDDVDIKENPQNKSREQKFSWEENHVGDKWGTGIVWYFRFLKFIILFDLILFLLSWITFLPHIISVINQFKETKNENQDHQNNNITDSSTSVALTVLNAITLSNYTDQELPSWYAFSAISFFLVLIMSILYQQIVINRHPLEDKYFGQYEMQHHNQPAINTVIHISAFNNKHTIFDLHNTHELNQYEHTRLQKCLRNLLSVILFLGFIILFSVILYYTQKVSQNYSSSTTFSSFILASVHGTVKSFCAFLCRLLSYVEIHEYYSSKEIWESSRVFTFELFCYFAFYFIRQFGLEEQQTLYPNSDACSIHSLGMQHLLLSISFMYSDFFDSIVLTWIINKYRKWKNIRIVTQNEQLLCEFKLAEQYTRMFFRQALLCSGITFLLGSPLIASFGHLIQFYCDRYRLLHLTHVEHRNQSSFIKMIHCYSLVFSLILLFGYPKGYFWLWFNQTTFFNCDSFKHFDLNF